MTDQTQFRTYDRAASVVFRKTNEEFGGLSNMAAGFPLEVNGLAIRSAEALYQACRFPHRPDLQRHIIDQRSPMTAKMVGKPHRHDSRRDWDRVRVAIMRWTLRVKLAQNWSAFGELLLATGERPIVEDSRRDDFWGAIRVDSQTLAGMNVLGRLLMELREDLRDRGTALLTVEPPAIGDFLLDGQPIEAIRGAEARLRPVLENHRADEVRQPSLFDDQPPAQPEEPRRMIADLFPYPAYRDSDVPWLGDVPEHWEVRRLGQVGSLSKGSGGSREDEVPEGVPCIRYGQLYTTYTRFIERARSYVSPERADAYTPIRFGDVLFAGSGETIEEIGKSAVNLMEGEVRCGGDVILFRPRIAIDPRFLGYATDCPPVAAQKATMGRGITIMHLYADELKYLAIPLPPSEEQATIVRYLDHADGRIRRYIRAKQRLIALLEERKQAITHRAVTRGLDPDVPLRPSGVEWLGDIPAHWEVRRLGRLAEITPGFAFKSEGFTDDPDGVRLLRGINISPGSVRWDSTVRWDPRETHYYEEYRLEVDDLVFGMDRPFISTGTRLAQIRQSDVPSFVLQRVARLRARQSLSQDYLAVLLSGQQLRHHLEPVFTGISVPHVSPQQIADFPLVLPPIEEQLGILRSLNTETSQLSAAMEKARAEIELLREYRTRLIADVVTGKFDVRKAATRLPEEADAPEPLDDLDLPDDELEDLDAEKAELEEAAR